MEAIAAMAAFFFVLKSGGWHYGQVLSAGNPLYRGATTACFAAIVLTQVANLFACRSETGSVFSLSFGNNRLLLIGIAVELGLLAFIVYTPWGNLIFGTAPLRPSAWLFMLPFPPAMLALEELRKWIRRRAAR
jgi:magnesium-transporting ATPase (P-type)